MKKNDYPTLYIEKLNEDAELPKRAHATDSGFDLYANNIKKVYAHGGGNGERLLDGTVEDSAQATKNLKLRLTDDNLELQYLERALIGTGIRATVGPGYEIQVRPRSGLALKRGLTVLNSPGTVDEAYRGEICVIVVNNSRKAQSIEPSERIAQLVVAPVILPEIKLVENLPEAASDRAEGGFGSSGEK